MAASTIFMTAADARQNPIREATIHDEARAIEGAILDGVRMGLYSATLSEGSPMTDATTATVAIGAMDLDTDQITVPNHPFASGDLVTVSSTGSLPAPLDSAAFYTVQYIDADHIKLAATTPDALRGRPITIDFTVGVTGVGLVDGGSGYLVTPRVMIDPPASGTTAVAVANLASWGSIDGIAVLSPGRGYTDVPTVTIQANGANGVAGTIGYLAVNVTVAAGGSNYRLGDVLSVVGGTGQPTTATVVQITTGGIVTAVTLGNPGSYTTMPNLAGAPTAVQPGGGTGCTLNLVMGIGSIGVATGGFGYTAPPVVTISGGMGARASAIVSAGTIVAFRIDACGAGYTSDPIITIDPGTGAAAAAVLQPTGVGTITVIDGGGGSYVTAPTVQLTAQGAGATAGTITMGVIGATLTNAGGGYTTGDVLMIAGGAGTSNATLQVTKVGVLGEILGWTLLTSGAYTTLPILNSNSVLGGTGRSATFSLRMGLESVELAAAGSGYTAAPVVLITPADGNGLGAKAIARLSGDLVSSILVTAAGGGYTAIPTITITSGDGAAAVATIDAGSITAIQIVAPGTNYTAPPIVTLSGAGTARANLASTGVARIDVTSGGDHWVGAPIVQVVPSPNQEGSVVAPSTATRIGYGLASITVTSAGSGYSTTPGVSIDAPTGQTATQATAQATIGAGTGTTVISPYPTARDYWKVWKNQTPSNPALARPYAERMDTVINHFTNLGYTITRQTNPATGNTIQWNVLW